MEREAGGIEIGRSRNAAISDAYHSHRAGRSVINRPITAGTAGLTAYNLQSPKTGLLMFVSRRLLLGSIYVLLLSAQSAAAADDPGVLPLGADGKPLNLDFERGTLDDWTADGEAFQRQPIRGDIDQNRKFGGGKHAGPQGDFWIGGYERFEDKPQGTLTSAPFKVSHPFAMFLLGGGQHAETRVELVRKDTGAVFFKASGANNETMSPTVVDLRPQAGQEIFIRVVDQRSDGWGHVNFDNFRFYATEPKVQRQPNQPGQPLPADTYEFAGLSPDEAAAAMTLPSGFSVTAFAGEPDVRQPIAMALDDRGRLWVAEAYSYPRRVPEGQGEDRILIFEDADGDGKFDKRTVFAEKLNLVSGLEVGFGGVWVGAAPEFLFIPDANRRRRSRRTAAGIARRLGSTGHARNAEHVHLGPGRLALWLPRRVHPFARRQAGHARRRTDSDERRRSGATIPRGTRSKSFATARAIPGASISTTRGRRF